MSEQTSIIIPSRDEGPWLQRTVEDVRANTNPDLLREIIVVDDGSTDGSATGPIEATIIATDGVGIARAKNIGAMRAQGEVLVFLDAHSYVGHGWIEALLDTLHLGYAAAAPSLISFSQEEGADRFSWESAPLLGRQFMAAAPPYHVERWDVPEGRPVPLGHGACQVIDAKVFRRIGGFCELLSPMGGEDTEICLRLYSRGYRIGAAPDAQVWTLQKNWSTRPANGSLAATVWTNLVMAQCLHWSPVRMAEMWWHIARDWQQHSDLFAQVWESCHSTDVLGLRREMRAAATLSDDQFFAEFPPIARSE